MKKRFIRFCFSSLTILAFIFILGQNAPGGVRASPTVDDIIVVPRNYQFTWGSSGQNIDANNDVYCSSNPDFWQVLYWRTSDTDSNAGVNDWNPNVPVAGNYDIYAYITNYSHYAGITTQARYYLDGNLLATLDQNQNKCDPNVPGSGWVLLGRRWLNAGYGQTFSMPVQNPGEQCYPTNYCLVAGDGLKLVYVQETFSISGRVADSGNNPFADVTITTDQGQSAATDSNGNFSIPNLPVGTYTLTPSSSNGYAFFPATRTVTLPPDATGQDFTVTNLNWITGKLMDTLGNPIPNVNVECQGLTTLMNTTTDSAGKYVFYKLVPGLYQVRPDSTVYQFKPTVSGWMFTPPNRTDVNFYTDPVYGSMSGQVTHEGTSNPVANAAVNAAGKATQTDAAGNYSLSGLLPGTHVVRVTANGYNNYEDSVVIQVNANTVKNVVLRPVYVDGYRLPFPGGTTYQLFNTSHPSGYAQDWSRGGMNGDDVVASRAGKVYFVKEYSNSGGCSKDYYGKENYVTLLHSDNTKTYYVHLKQWSVPVNQGDYVRAGQVIGKSGRTGYNCGEHLHFAWLVNGVRTVPYFLDIPGYAQEKHWYTSGNFLQPLGLANLEPGDEIVDAIAPVGSFQFRLTGQPTYQVQIDTFDYDSNVLKMRVATTESDLPSAAWVNVKDSINWTAPIIWGQFKDDTGNISSVYSDTIESIAYEPIQAAFTVSPNICAGTEPTITNQTFPLCEQCGWLWDYGDGNTSPLMNPALPYLTGVYAQASFYTITLTAANVNGTSSAAHPVTVLPNPSAEFSLTRVGNTITVVAAEENATSWVWYFGDGSTATGRTASHTYADHTALESSTVMLTVENAFSCSNVGYQQPLIVYKIFLPSLIK